MVVTKIKLNKLIMKKKKKHVGLFTWITLQQQQNNCFLDNNGEILVTKGPALGSLPIPAQKPNMTQILWTLVVFPGFLRSGCIGITVFDGFEGIQMYTTIKL